jgi:hypothetical protein
MIDWPEDIVSSIARRRAVLFLGAGVSRNSRNAAGLHPLTWHEFLQAGILRCPAPRKEMAQFLKNGDYLTCCQLIKHKMNTDWIPFLEETFLAPQFLPHDIHKAIFKLDASVVVTPNFDKIYDNLAQATTNNLLRIKKYYDDDIPRALRAGGQQRLILKLHGCIDTPDKLVFTRQDYADVRHKHANFYRAIDALILTHTFIFVGCGMNDPDLALLLEQYARSFASAPPHYILFGRKVSGDYQHLLETNYNIKVIPYSPANDHEELTSSLVQLGVAIEAKRDELAKTMLW